MECGECGGAKCGERQGGKEACCTQLIPKRQICGVNNQKAPCHIKGARFRTLANDQKSNEIFPYHSRFIIS